MNKLTKIKDLQMMADIIREDTITSLTQAKSGHSAGSLGMADIFTVLYFNVLKHDPKKPKWEGRDRLVLSNGHICPVMYAAMANAGYFPKKELLTLRKLGTRLQGHPHRETLPGLETTSGPLGCGLSQAVGMAYGLRLDKKPNLVFCLCSDGEQDEGNHWEAVMFAAKNKLNNLIAITDRNYIQIDGNTEEVMPLNPLDEKYKAFNWNVKVIDGNSVKEILDALNKACKNLNGPLMIIANTIPGKGIDYMENDHTWHGKSPKPEEAEQALAELHAHEVEERGDWFKQHQKFMPLHVLAEKIRNQLKK
ncbi:MAG: transketolase [Nanoarchaeota archaeon]